MKLDKLKNTYNDYKVELSWGQLEVIAAALEADHSDPVADELYAELRWYMERVPGPGEEEEDAKNREAGGMAGPGGDDFDVPLPPGNGAADTGAEPPGPLDGMEGGEEGLPPEGGAPAPGAEGGAPGDEGGVPPPPGDEAGKIPLEGDGQVPIGKEAFDAAKQRNQGGGEVPPPPMESARPKAAKGRRVVENLDQHAAAVLTDAGLQDGRDFAFDRGLKVTEQAAAAAVGALNASRQFSNAVYHPETGYVTYGAASKIVQPAAVPAGAEALPAPPVE